MKTSRLKIIRRVVLRHLVEALIMMGPAFGFCSSVVVEASGRMDREAERAASLDNPHADYTELRRVGAMAEEFSPTAVYIEPFKPLSQAERTEWAALVERLG